MAQGRVNSIPVNPLSKSCGPFLGKLPAPQGILILLPGTGSRGPQIDCEEGAEAWHKPELLTINKNQHSINTASQISKIS